MIAKTLWKVMDEADIVCGHNSDCFDNKWVNTMFITNGMRPASPFQSIDTKKASKSNFYMISNKLENLGRKLKIGQKLDHHGFRLWKDCMAGDPKAWDHMVRYCKQDTILVEKLYNLMKPFMKTHPNMAVFAQDKECCVVCQSPKLKKKGLRHKGSGKYQRWVCGDCGRWHTSKHNLLSKDDRRKLLK